MKIFIMFLVLLTIAVASNAQNIQFVTENYPPFQIKKGENPPEGFAIELVEAMKKKAGLNAKIQMLPWGRAYRIAQHEPNAFIFSIAMSKEREESFKWIGNYFEAINAIYTLSSNENITITSLDSAKKYKTCVPRGDNSAVILEKRGFNKKHLRYVTTQTQCILMLHRKRVDLNMNSELGFFTIVKKLKLEATQFKRVFIESIVPLGIAANKNSDVTLVKKMQRALEELKVDGTHEKLMKKWFPDM